MVSFDYYAFWNANQIVSVLNAVAGLVNTNAYGTLLRAIGVFGLLVAVLSSIWRTRLADAVAYVFVFTLMYMGLVLPKVNVTVKDVQAGTATVVSNVPLGIGFFASELTHIGYWMTTAYETAFAPADDVGKFAKFGLAGPQRVLDSALKATVQLPVVKINMANFMRDCVIPELIDNFRKVVDITNSTNLFTTIATSGWLNPARTSMMQVATPATAAVDGVGTIVATAQDCNSALGTVLAQLDAGTKDTINRLAAHGIGTAMGLVNTPTGVGALSPAGTYYSEQVAHAANIMMGYTTTAEEIIKSQAGLAALDAATASVAAPLGAAVGQATTVANLGTAINYRSMGQVAKEALPKLRNSIELLVVAMFPIMMVLVLVSGLQSMQILKGYLIMLLWTQLWAPIYAVINFMVITSDQSPYTQALAAVGTFSASAMQLIADLGASSQDTAGMLALSVPMIALALAKGGEMALSSMASGVLQPATSAAQSSGSALGGGNSNIGNATWGNFSSGNASSGSMQLGNTSMGQARTGMNVDSSIGLNTGDSGWTSRLGADGSVTRDASGGGGGHARFDVPKGGTGAIVSPTSSAEMSLENGASSARGSAWQAQRSAEFSRTVGAALRDAFSGNQSHGFNQAFQASWRQQETGETGLRSVASSMIQRAAALESRADAAEQVRMGGTVGIAARGGNEGPPTGAAPAAGGGSASPPATASAGAGAAPGGNAGAPGALPSSAVTGAGGGLIDPNSPQARIPPGMRNQAASTTAGDSGLVDPNSAQARIPPSMRQPAATTPSAAASLGSASPGGPAPTSTPAQMRQEARGLRSAAEAITSALPVNAGYNAGTEATTAVTDAARRSYTGTASAQDEKILSAAQQAARAMQYESGEKSTQEAGRRIEAALNKATESRTGSGVTAGDSARGETERRQSNSGSIRSGVDMSDKLAGQMRAMFPEKYGSGPSGDKALAQDMRSGSPEAVAAANALFNGASANLATAQPSGQPLKPPESPSAIRAEGQGRVASAGPKNDANAKAAYSGFASAVSGFMGGMDPQGMAVSDLPGQVSQQIAARGGQAQVNEQRTETSAGMAQFAAAQFASERSSGTEPLKLALRTLGFGAGYESPQQTAAALQSLQPYMSPEGQKFFQGLGSGPNTNGGQISAQQMKEGMGYIEQATSAKLQAEKPALAEALARGSLNDSPVFSTPL